MVSAAPQKRSAEIRDLGGFWGPLQGCPAALLPPLPCLYPALPCYGWYPPPPGSITQPAQAPCCQLPGGVPLPWPVPPLGSPLLCTGSLDDRRWGKAARWQESTGALRAWLGQHLQNPYPSKGEKVLLAVLSQRSLSQVSTWFANARRRLKKENRLHGAPRPLKAPGEEEEEEEDKKGPARGEREDPGSGPQPKRPQAPWGSSGAIDPWRESRRGPDPLPSTGQGMAERLPPEPKLRSPAEPATCHLPGKPPHWVWGLCPLRRASGLQENPGCASREGRREAPPPGPDPWGHPGELSGAERGVALPSRSWYALEVLDYSAQDAQLACQLVMQACGSAHLESARLGKARASMGDCVAGSLLCTGSEGSFSTRRAAGQINPLGQGWN